MGKIIFDINSFAEQFEKTIDWMLREGEDGKEVLKRIEKYQDNYKNLQNKPDYLNALKMIVELLESNSYNPRRPLSKKFKERWQKFTSSHGHNFRTDVAKEALVNMARDDKKRNVDELLKQYQTIKEFTEKLHELAKKGKTIVLGEKGRDIYLRDFGYWDRAPIDIHEKRFIVRTGIYHACASKDSSDPTSYAHLQKALVEFCRKSLKGEVCGIQLCNAPGIVDVFNWAYCAKKVKTEKGRFGICEETPHCKECCFDKVCLYYLGRMFEH